LQSNNGQPHSKRENSVENSLKLNAGTRRRGHDTLLATLDNDVKQDQ
jgi:hypothetical protein